MGQANTIQLQNAKLVQSFSTATRDLWKRLLHTAAWVFDYGVGGKRPEWDLGTCEVVQGNLEKDLIENSERCLFYLIP